VDEALGSFRALNIYRSFLIGAVGALGAVLIDPAILKSLPNDQPGAGNALLQASLLFGVSVALGTLVYTIHRAIVYPIVLRWVLAVLCIFRWYPLHWSLFQPFGCPLVREARKSLWLARRDKNNPFIKPLTAWSDQVQFLYASGLLLASLVWIVPWVVPVVRLPYAPLNRGACLVAVSAVALLGIAIINDLRLSWVTSDVLRVAWQFTKRDQRFPWLLCLAHSAFLVLGGWAFYRFALWTIRSHC